MEANVLLVDGVAAYRSMLAAKLGALGCAVFEAGTAAEARRHVVTRSFDVIVVDNSLPDQEGAALVSQLVDSGGTASIVLVVEPGERSSDLEAAARRLGAEQVVEGPVHPNALIVTVRKLLGVRSSTPPTPTATSSAPPPSPRPLAAGRAAVLLASSDAGIRDRVVGLLRAHGTTVLAVDEPAKVASSLEHLRPQLAIIDAEIAGAGGFDLCRQLRAADPWRDLPILLLVSAGSPVERRACYEAGGDDFVEKPIAEAELCARVRVHVDLRLLLEERRPPL